MNIVVVFWTTAKDVYQANRMAYNYSTVQYSTAVDLERPLLVNTMEPWCLGQGWRTQIAKGKGKDHPRTDHEGPEGE